MLRIDQQYSWMCLIYVADCVYLHTRQRSERIETGPVRVHDTQPDNMPRFKIDEGHAPPYRAYYNRGRRSVSMGSMARTDIATRDINVN